MANPRPERCPHEDCEYINCVGGGAFCKGKLPIPIDHDGQDNTHRLCFIQFDGGVYDFQMNKGDMWSLVRLLQQDPTPKPSTSSAPTSDESLDTDKGKETLRCPHDGTYLYLVGKNVKPTLIYQCRVCGHLKYQQDPDPKDTVEVKDKVQDQ